MTATHCGFAFPGTYGHECGSPATLVGVRKSDLTTNGVFYARRCAKCATIKGGENAGISSFLPFDASKHANAWR